VSCSLTRRVGFECVVVRERGAAGSDEGHVEQNAKFYAEGAGAVQCGAISSQDC
jgi:hypothetical protein